MDSSTARDHLASAAAIVRAADRSLNVQPWIFVVWGLFGASVNVVQQARAAGLAVPSDSTVQLPLLLAAIGATVAISLGTPGRETLVDRHTGIVFSVVFAVLLVANVAAQHRVVPADGMALFWSFGLAMALLIVGFEASRPLLAGGVALVTASVAACWAAGWFHGLLAAGWLAGMVVPGVVLAWRRSHGRAAAL